MQSASEQYAPGRCFYYSFMRNIRFGRDVGKNRTYAAEKLYRARQKKLRSARKDRFSRFYL